MRGQREEPAGDNRTSSREDTQGVRRIDAATWRIHSVERLSYGALAASFQLEIAEIVSDPLRALRAGRSGAVCLADEGPQWLRAFRGRCDARAAVRGGRAWRCRRTVGCRRAACLIMARQGDTAKFRGVSICGIPFGWGCICGAPLGASAQGRSASCRERSQSVDFGRL